MSYMILLHTAVFNLIKAYFILYNYGNRNFKYLYYRLLYQNIWESLHIRCCLVRCQCT